MSTMTVALYARVSSEQQAQAHTIDSQLAALRERIAQDGAQLSPQHEFIDQGYSGSTLIRPALERLRDAVAAGEIERLYVHSPDRLARKYAYQVMLVDECQRAGVTIAFLNRALGNSPEDELLLQVQGMIAEYERAKMLERSRRGKRHRAQQGAVNVLSGAPYGYRYVSVADGGGQARYEIDAEQAQVVRRIFDWVGRQRLSLADVCRRLADEATASPRGKGWWDRTTVWGLLKNPAYRGQAAFGKTHAGDLRPRLRAQRGRTLTPRSGRSTYDVPAVEWLSIPVPALVSEALFDAVQTQLEENRRRARCNERGAKYLLQGLLVCACCGYAYYGKPISPSARKHRPREYAYYRCIGSDACRFGGQRLCHNKQLRTDRLEQAVWAEVCRLLEDPQRLAHEYGRRLDAVQTPPGEADAAVLERQMAKVRQGVARLIDGYAEGYLEKTEAEPRIRRFRERLQALEAQAEQVRTQARQEADLQLVIGRLEVFSAQVSAGLEQLDWIGRRDLIRTLVKRVEIEPECIRVVFRIDEDPPPSGPDSGLHHCCRRKWPALRRAHLAGLDVLTDQHPGAQVAPDQAQQPLVGDGSSQQAHQHVVIDRVEELGQIEVHRDASATLHVGLHLPDRLMCIAARSKAEARIREPRIEDRREHLGDGLLDHTVCDRGNSEHAFAAVGFGDFHPSHRLRPVSPALDPRAQRRPVFARMGGEVLHGHAVDARRSLVGLHPFPRARQVVSGQHRGKQVLGCRCFVLVQGSVRAGRRRIFPGRGRRCGRGRQRRNRSEPRPSQRGIRRHTRHSDSPAKEALRLWHAVRRSVTDPRAEVPYVDPR